MAYTGNYHYYLDKIAEEKQKAKQANLAAEKCAKEREKEQAMKSGSPVTI